MAEPKDRRQASLMEGRHCRLTLVPGCSSMYPADYRRTARRDRGRLNLPDENRQPARSLVSQLSRLLWLDQTVTGTPGNHQTRTEPGDPRGESRSSRPSRARRPRNPFGVRGRLPSAPSLPTSEGSMSPAVVQPQPKAVDLET